MTTRTDIARANAVWTRTSRVYSWYVFFIRAARRFREKSSRSNTWSLIVPKASAAGICLLTSPRKSCRLPDEMEDVAHLF